MIENVIPSANNSSFLILAIIVAGTLLVPISISTLQLEVYAIQIRTDTEPGSVAMSSFDLAQDNQTSQQIDIMEPSTTSSIPEKLSKGITPDGTITLLSTYKITVVFDSITVHDDHEGLFSGDGEYDFSAYVQGIPLDLTNASIPDSPIYIYGEIPPEGLGDVSEGETVKFTPEASSVTLDLPRNVPLSIFTLGKELDSCDYEIGANKLPKSLLEIFRNPQLDWYGPITQYINENNGAECGYGDSENLGNIVRFYNPPGQSYEPIGYGAGAHTNVVSDSGDYTLRYTITVVPPPNLDQKKTVLGTDNNFSLNNGFSSGSLIP